MSIRVLVCGLLIVYFSVKAWRDYFPSLCAAVLLMAFMQHPDVEANLKNIGGIQGLNPFNVLMGNVLLAWINQRRLEGLTWDMPGLLQRLLIGYFLVVTLSFLRLFIHPADWPDPSATWMISEFFINTIKFVAPGLILYDVCRTRRRVVVGLASVLALYVLLAAQVAKHVPPSYVNADNFQHVAYKIVQDAVGYNRVTLSMMLGGASWAVLAFLPLTKTRRQRWGTMGATALVAYGQALTGGRSGYVGWLAVGLVMCIVRWRRMLLLIPAVIIFVCIFLPGVRNRVLTGFNTPEKNSNGPSAAYEISSGRNIAWPYVIKQIWKGPIFGFGRDAMLTTKIYDQILIDTNYSESFPHPHNAYLEVLLDMGFVGFIIIVPFYLICLRNGFRLFLDRSDPIYEAAGGVCCALVLALMVAAMGGETFYPREGAVGMWAAMGIMLRVYTDRENGTIEQEETEAPVEEPEFDAMGQAF